MTSAISLTANSLDIPAMRLYAAFVEQISTNMRSKLNFAAKPVVAFLLLFILLAPALFAQTNQPAGKKTPSSGGNRFLFIVDTSASMKSSAGDMQQAVGEIIRSSASGQIHPGDTLGVWTFNRELYPGVLPLQTWTTEDKEEIALRTLAFLKNQRYGKESRLPAALDGMFTVIKASDIITVFIISDGRSPMQGTPFDQQINSLYIESVKEMKKNHKPIVTVLQAKRGKIIKFTVNALPWPVVIPEVPIPIKGLETAEDNAPAAPAKSAPPAPKLAPPLIVEGNPPPAKAPPPAPAPVTTSPPAPALTPQNTTVKTAPPVRPQNLTATQVPAPPSSKPTPPPRLAPPIGFAQNSVPNPAPSSRPASAGPISTPASQPIPPADKTPVTQRRQGNLTEATSALHEHKHTNAAAAGAPPSTPKAANATSTPTTRVLGFTLTQPKILLIGAIIAAVIAFSLIGLLLFRLKAASGPSFITRTMGNPPKK